MECRCFRQGCSVNEQVCRPRIKQNAQCTIPSGPDDMVTRSCEIGYMCNGLAKHPYCAKLFSIPNGHLASDDQLCVSQYRDGIGNCTAWPNPTLVAPGSACDTNSDCVSIPAGHGRCSCTTNPSANQAQCVLKQTEAPDAKLAALSWVSSRGLRVAADPQWHVHVIIGSVALRITRQLSHRRLHVTRGHVFLPPNLFIRGMLDSVRSLGVSLARTRMGKANADV